MTKSISGLGRLDDFESAWANRSHGKRLRAVRRLHDLVPFPLERLGEKFANALFVVGDQNSGIAHALKLKVKIAPPSG